jgi:DNA polymerase III, epsilon subunit, Proteobacterial
MREIVIDTETTGLSHKTGDRIIEVGCVELKNYIPTGNQLQFYCRPDKSISEGAKNIVGLSDDFLTQQKTFKENHLKLLNFIKNDTLIIHNSEFDLGFLNNELSLIGLSPLNNPVIDTVSLARKVLNTRMANLDYLCRRFNIDLSDRSFHGALLDSQLLAAVYLELRGGKQFSMELDTTIKQDEKSLINDVNKEKTKKLKISEDDLSTHKEMLKKIKNPIGINLTINMKKVII